MKKKQSFLHILKETIREQDSRKLVLGPVLLGIVVFIITIAITKFFKPDPIPITVFNCTGVIIIPLFIFSGIVVVLKKEIPGISPRSTTRGGWAVIQGIFWLVFWIIFEIAMVLAIFT